MTYEEAEFLKLKGQICKQFGLSKLETILKIAEFKSYTLQRVKLSVATIGM
jgi:hypothetical protein